jgi:hypothetical protein
VAGVPTSSDNVFVNAASGAATITLGATANCLNADFTGFIGSVTASSATLNIYGDINWPITATYSGAGYFNFPGTATRTINFNRCSLISGTFLYIQIKNAGPYTVTLPNSSFVYLVLDWSSSPTLSPTYNIYGDGCLISDIDFYGTGNAIINFNGAFQVININDAYLGSNNKYTLNFNSNINLYGNANIKFASSNAIINSNGYGLYQTITSNAIITILPSVIYGNNISYYATVSAASGSYVAIDIGSGNSGAYKTVYLNNLSVIQTTACNVNLLFNGQQGSYSVYQADVSLNGTLTLNGYSQKYRIFAYASIYQSGFNAANVVLNNVDFYGIVNTSSFTWVGTNLGNCGYNTPNITFTTAVQRYAVTANSDWNSIGWSSTSGGSSGASSPLPQDTVYLDANTPAGTYQFTSTSNVPRIGTVDFTGFNQTITLTTDQVFYGGLTLSPTMTWNTGVQTCYFKGGQSSFITSNGKTFYIVQIGPDQTFNLYINYISLPSYTFVDLTTITNRLDCLGNSVVNFLSNITTGTIRCIHGMSSASSNVYNFNNIDFNATDTADFGYDAFFSDQYTTITGNLNINILGTSSNKRQISTYGNNFVINSINIIGISNASNVFFQFSTTVKTITSQSKVKYKISLPSSGTFTVTNFNASGDSLYNYLNLTSTGSAQSTLIKYGGGTVTLNNTTVNNVIASPTSTWFIMNGLVNVLNSFYWDIYGNIFKTIVAFLTSGTTYTVPAKVISFTSIEGIGGGGGGGGSSTTGGGGAGAYAAVTTNASNITSGQTIYYSIGSGGTRGVNGGDTWLNIGSNTPPTTAAQGIVAKGGKTATTISGGAGGASSACVGDSRLSGGGGGSASLTFGGGGGGGGASTSIVDFPGAGANSGNAPGNGGGGGAAATGENYPGYATSTGYGGQGNGNFSSGGGAGPGATNNSGQNATATLGDGGGGGGYSTALPNTVNGGNGSTLTLWRATAGGTAGPGGGGGGTGGNSVTSIAGNGGLYGGGGGGPNSNASPSGGSGAQGIIVLTYILLTSDYVVPPLSSNTINGFVGYVDLSPDSAVGVLGNITTDYQVPLAGVYGTAFNPFILPSYNPSDVALGVLGNLTASVLNGLNTIDRTQEVITDTNGSNIMNISGLSPQGFQTFFASGQAYNLYYTVTDGINWETGLGQYVGTVTAGTITTVQVLASSNGGAAITKTIGMRIFITYAAAKTAILDNTGTCNIPFGPTNLVVGVNNVALATSMSS